LTGGALRNTTAWRPISVATVLLVGALSVAGTAQQPQLVTMQDPTVPNDRLPDLCSLKVIEPA
jgi:hypothetical protein